jgi:hypothetical protein
MALPGELNRQASGEVGKEICATRICPQESKITAIELRNKITPRLLCLSRDVRSRPLGAGGCYLRFIRLHYSWLTTFRQTRPTLCKYGEHNHAIIGPMAIHKVQDV